MKEENNMVSSKIESLTDQMHAMHTPHSVLTSSIPGEGMNK